MKKKTLEELYNELASDEMRWSYYNNAPSITGSWKQSKDAIKFIKDYYQFAGKSEVLRYEYFTTHFEQVKERTPHIISTFLLGILIAEGFGVDTQCRDGNNLNFLYYWFLCCIYHDIGYCYENVPFVEDLKNNENLQIIGNEGIESLQELYDIKYLHNRIFKTYSQAKIDFYLKCRAKDTNSLGLKACVDHGIIGGILLYDKLRKQFEIAWKNRKNKEEHRDYFLVDVCGRELYWSNKHFNEYAKASDAIMAHNIYKSTFNKYLDIYPHNNSIKPIVNKISKNNLYLFILALADTLEPLKRGISLDNVQIEIRDKKIYINIDRVVDARQANNYLKTIGELNSWMNVDVDVTQLGNITIGVKESEDTMFSLWNNLIVDRVI